MAHLVSYRFESDSGSIPWFNRWYSNTWANFSEGRVNITENLL